MKQMIEKIKKNKILKVIWNTIYSLLAILAILMLLVVVLQRVSDNSISLCGVRIFNILSESMVPKYQVGDVLISKYVEPKDIKQGDDLVYKGEVGTFTGKVITHQVIKIENDGSKYKFHTKGIANDQEDPIVGENQIYGVVVYKTVVLSFIFKILNNLYGFYFLVFVPLVIIIFVQIVKIIKSMKKNNKDDKK